MYSSLSENTLEDEVEEVTRYELPLSKTSLDIKMFKEVFSYLGEGSDVVQRHSVWLVSFAGRQSSDIYIWDPSYHPIECCLIVD